MKRTTVKINESESESESEEGEYDLNWTKDF